MATATVDRDELCRLPATRLTELIRRRQLSPVEAVRAVLERIDRLNPGLIAFTTVAAERALDQARTAEGAVMAGGALGPLHGVPISVKDSIWVSGVRCTWGSALYRDFVPDHDAIAVERLLAAGAIVVGKTNLPELSQKGFTDNRLFGTSRNPWDRERTPGGSTGGGAAAVAAGLGPLTLGTDAGGSIRRPASHTGLVGFKPSQGRVPLGPGFPSINPGYTVDGPLARTVADVAMMFDVLAGPHPSDRESFLPPLSAEIGRSAAWPAKLEGRRVAWSPDLGDRAVDPAVREICARAVGAFEELGCRVERADPPIPADFEATMTRAFGAPAMAEVLAPERARWGEVDPSLTATAELAETVTGREVYRALRRRAALFEELGAFFGRHDLLLTPTVAALPWPVTTEYPAEIDGRAAGPRGHAVFTPFANHLGLPAISVPAIGPRPVSRLAFRSSDHTSRTQRC